MLRSKRKLICQDLKNARLFQIFSCVAQIVSNKCNTQRKSEWWRWTQMATTSDSLSVSGSGSALRSLSPERSRPSHSYLTFRSFFIYMCSEKMRLCFNAAKRNKHQTRYLVTLLTHSISTSDSFTLWYSPRLMPIILSNNTLKEFLSIRK